jgi:hypothetical protein
MIFFVDDNKQQLRDDSLQLRTPNMLVVNNTFYNIDFV